jgi:hypothetical protein
MILGSFQAEFLFSFHTVAEVSAEAMFDFEVF